MLNHKNIKYFLSIVHHRPSTTTSNTHQGRIRVLMRREDPSPSGLTSGRDGANEFDFPGLVGNIRSELFIQGTGPADNGTYRCQAENKAATRKIWQIIINIRKSSFLRPSKYLSFRHNSFSEAFTSTM